MRGGERAAGGLQQVPVVFFWPPAYLGRSDRAKPVNDAERLLSFDLEVNRHLPSI